MYIVHITVSQYRLAYVWLSSCLGGLRWHLSGPSEVPLTQRLPSITCRRAFFFFQYVLDEPYFCFFLWAFFIVPCTSTLSSCIYAVLQYRKHSTAQRYQPAQSRTSTCPAECDNASMQTESIYCCCIAVPLTRHDTAQSARTKPLGRAKPPSKYVPIRVRQRKQADRVDESQHMSSIYTVRLSSQNERRNRNLPGQPKDTSTHTALVRCAKDFLPLVSVSIIRLTTLLFLAFLFYAIRTCMRRPGCCTGTHELLAFASRQFPPKIVDLSVRVIRTFFVLFFLFFLVSKRSGRRKPPPAERSALYIILVIHILRIFGSTCYTRVIRELCLVFDAIPHP